MTLGWGIAYHTQKGLFYGCWCLYLASWALLLAWPYYLSHHFPHFCISNSCPGSIFQNSITTISTILLSFPSALDVLYSVKLETGNEADADPKSVLLWLMLGLQCHNVPFVCMQFCLCCNFVPPTGIPTPIPPTPNATMMHTPPAGWVW